jgi:hypothetical protein
MNGNKNLAFKRLLDNSVTLVCVEQNWTKGQFENELASELNLSQHSVQRFRKGNLPNDEQLETIVYFIVRHGPPGIISQE